MLCETCKGKTASVHLTRIMGSKMQKLDLCDNCAKKQGVNDPQGVSLAALLEQMRKMPPSTENGLR